MSAFPFFLLNSGFCVPKYSVVIPNSLAVRNPLLLRPVIPNGFSHEESAFECEKQIPHR